MAQEAYMKVAVLAVAMVGLVCAGTSFGQETQENPGGQYRGKVEELLKELNLTPEQEAQVKEYQEASRPIMKELYRSLRETQRALKEELDKPAPDQAKVQALSLGMQDIQSRLIAQRVERSLHMKKILSPGQYRVFSQTLEKIHKENSGKRRRLQ